MIYLIDLDGTCADNSHRRGIVETDMPDWDAFLAPDLVAKDLPIESARDAIRRIEAHYGRIFYLTGRRDTLRDVTQDWIADHGFSCPEAILMREGNDMRGSTAVKTDHVDRLRAYATGFRPQIVCIDDDYRVLAAMAKIGVLALKAPECWPWIYPEGPTDDPTPRE